MGTCLNKPKSQPKQIIVKDKIVSSAGSNISIYSVYKIGKSIGIGTFGTVKIGYNLNNPKVKVAIKILFKNKLKTSAKRLQYEIDIIISLDHPNIIKCYETFEDEEHIYIVMEYCSGGELIDILPVTDPLDERTCLDIIRKVLMSVNHIHQMGIVHRDLKPENFLFSSSKSSKELKLADFGLSGKFSHKLEKLHSTVGTPFYIAPEVLRGNYDSKCDIWSIGVLLYVMISGALPFYAENVVEVFKKIEIGSYNMEGFRWRRISEECKHLISRLICLNVKDRLSSYEALMHPVIHQIPASLSECNYLESLLKYSQTSFTQKCFSQALVKFLDFDMILAQRNIFTHFDRKLTGTIGATEICDVFEEARVDFSQSQITTAFSTIGVRSKRKMHFSEFVSMLGIEPEWITEINLKLAFEFFDRDRKGFFDIGNFEKALEYLGAHLTSMEVKENFGSITSTEILTYEEFKKLM